MLGESNSTSSDHEQVMGKKQTMRCRRFSDEQIKSLESVFKREKKLEPRKKLEMARELGLQPRQVAIWFQNRRARWKSKQVEQDYNNLKAEYDTLNHRFQSLNKEKHELLHQLSSLCSQLKDDEENIIIKELDGEHDHDTMAIYSDEDDPMIPIKQELDNININNIMHQKPIEEEESSRHENFDQLGSLFDHSCSNWWDIWSSN